MQIMNLLLKNSAYVSHMMFRAGEPFSISSINLIMEAFQLSEMKVEEIVFTYGIECARPEKQRFSDYEEYNRQNDAVISLDKVSVIGFSLYMPESVKCNVRIEPEKDSVSFIFMGKNREKIKSGMQQYTEKFRKILENAEGIVFDGKAGVDGRRQADFI